MISRLLSLRMLVLALSLPVMPAMATGDIEYGAYLAAECAACHQPSDTDGAIPNLNGYDAEIFIEIMNLYRAKELENASMQNVAARLQDEDIAALAAYFASLEAPE